MGHTCEICGEQFPTEKELYLHQGLDHRQEAIKDVGVKCPECGDRFKSEKVLQLHKQELHGSKASSSKQEINEKFKSQGPSYGEKLVSADKRKLIKENWVSLVFLLLISGFLVIQTPIMSSQGYPRSNQAASPSPPPGNTASQNSTNMSTSTIPSSGELPPKADYNKCSDHRDCAPTCCGAYNQKHRDECSKTCERSELHIAACIQGRCVSTNQKVPTKN